MKPEVHRSHPDQAHLEWIAWLLDEAIPIPGTRIRIGLDGLIGLIPGIGDLIGAVASTYIINISARLGAPKILLMRMAWNVLIETLVGTIPFLGDLFDFAWKANSKNVVLLRDFLRDPKGVQRSSILFTVALSGAILAAVVGIAWLTFLLAAWLVRLVGA